MTASATSTRKFSASEHLATFPTGADAILVVELATTSQSRERTKSHDYARGDVPVYWLIDLEARTVDVYTDPSATTGRYRSRISLSDEDTLTLPELDTTWHVASLLP